MNENKNISPEDARDRIEKDCFGIWSRRTILDALPDEAKNPEKQKSGRLGQKKKNFAAVTAAPEVREILLDTDGRSIGQDLPNLPASAVDDSLAAGGSTIHESSEHRSNRQIKANIKECPNCEELTAANQGLKEALRKATTLSTADTIRTPNPTKPETDSILNFQISLAYSDLQQYMAALFQTGENKVWFSIKIDASTKKIISVKIGRISKLYDRVIL
jgi:hypothetical protein